MTSREHHGVFTHRQLDHLFNSKENICSTAKTISKLSIIGRWWGEVIEWPVFPSERGSNADACFHIMMSCVKQGPLLLHDDVIKWKHFPRYWPFVRGIHRSPVNSPHKGQWREALMFSLICTWISGWENNRESGDLRRHRAHYDVNAEINWTHGMDK